MIGSVAMMLELSFGLKQEANQIWQAMQSVFAAGYTTPDLKGPAQSATGAAKPKEAMAAATANEATQTKAAARQPEQMTPKERLLNPS